MIHESQMSAGLRQNQNKQRTTTAVCPKVVAPAAIVGKYNTNNHKIFVSDVSSLYTIDANAMSFHSCPLYG
jgi:hypothetical protein